MGHKSNNCQSNLTGVLRSAKEASEQLLNKDFEKRFEDECKLLRAPNVTLNFPGRQGQVTRRKLVASYKPSQVLSEGEQKALALADFLAEVTSVPASSPVVFDDPITSMDHRPSMKSATASSLLPKTIRLSSSPTISGSQPNYSVPTKGTGSTTTSGSKVAMPVWSRRRPILASTPSRRSAVESKN